MSQVMVAMPSASMVVLIIFGILFCRGRATPWRDHVLSQERRATEWRAPSKRSDALDDRRGAHAGADAQRGEAGAEVAPLHLVEQRAQDHGAGGAQRMAHGDR